MAKCIKTGCDLLIEEYNATVRCDVHIIDEDDPIVIFKFNPHSWQYSHASFDCRAFIGTGYFEESGGVLVVPLSNCDISKYFRR
jgi:hypothetical protein